MTSEETRLAALAGRSVCASMARLALLLLALVASALAIANGVGRLPAMGWNTWCTESLECIDDYCTEAEVMAVADGTPDPQSPGGTLSENIRCMEPPLMRARIGASPELPVSTAFVVSCAKRPSLRALRP